MTKPARALVFLSLAAMLVACASPTPELGSKPEPLAPALITQPAPPTVTPTSGPLSVYLAPETPEALVAETGNWGIPVASDPEKATLRLELASAGDESTIVSESTWLYALVAPFPTVTDGVTLDDLKSAWRGSLALPGTCVQCEIFDRSPLWMSASTLAVYAALWGEPATGAVQIAP